MTNDLFRDLLGIKPLPWQDEFMQALMEDAAEPSPALQAMQQIRPRAGYEIEWVEVDGTNSVIPVEVPTDPRARALWAKEQQGHGPAMTPLRVRGRTTHYKEKH